eukprot:6209691-Amphidinium_carterae.1
MVKNLMTVLTYSSLWGTVQIPSTADGVVPLQHPPQLFIALVTDATRDSKLAHQGRDISSQNGQISLLQELHLT